MINETKKQTFTITKRIAKHGSQAIIVIPRILEAHLKPGTVTQLTIEIVQDIRKVGISGPGNEHRATITPFENFMAGTEVPYLPVLLENMIAENIPELIPVKKLNLNEKK